MKETIFVLLIAIGIAGQCRNSAPSCVPIVSAAAAVVAQPRLVEVESMGSSVEVAPCTEVRCEVTGPSAVVCKSSNRLRARRLFFKGRRLLRLRQQR